MTPVRNPEQRELKEDIRRIIAASKDLLSHPLSRFCRMRKL
jgi:hypothetical protein